MTDQYNKRINFVQLEAEVKEGFKEWQDYNEYEKKQLKMRRGARGEDGGRKEQE